MLTVIAMMVKAFVFCFVVSILFLTAVSVDVAAFVSRARTHATQAVAQSASPAKRTADEAFSEGFPPQVVEKVKKRLEEFDASDLQIWAFLAKFVSDQAWYVGATRCLHSAGFIVVVGGKRVCIHVLC